MKIQFSNDKKILQSILIISVVFFCVAFIALISYIIKISSFEQVQAKITNIETVYSKSTKNNQNRNKYINYSFIYNGQHYEAQKLTLFSNKNQIGQNKIIKINSENPTEVANSLFVIIYCIIIVISVFLFIAISMYLFGGKV